MRRRGWSRKTRLEIGVDFAVGELEAVDHWFAGGFAPAGEQAGQPATEREARQAAGLGQEGEALFQGAGQEKDVAGVGVDVAHEALDALAGGALAVAEVIGDGGLEVFAPGHPWRDWRGGASRCGRGRRKS